MPAEIALVTSGEALAQRDGLAAIYRAAFAEPP
jgi:hypothetical protein